MKTLKTRAPSPRKAQPKSRAVSSERRVLDVLAHHPGWDVAQIAAELRMDVFEVADVVQPLIERGVVGKRA